MSSEPTSSTPTGTVALTPEALEALIASYFGGSLQRYRHPLNRKLICTDGVLAVLQATKAEWLWDLVANQLAPAYAEAWLAGTAGIGTVTVSVLNGVTTVSLTLDDDQPHLRQEQAQDNFPEGTWQFFLGTDDAGEEGYISSLILPCEY